MRTLATLALALTLAAQSQPARILFDTDMGNDIDDALALAMLHALETRGESKLLAVTLTKDNLKAAQYCDIVNHFYGRPRIPIGLVKNGRTPEDTPMVAVPVDRLDPSGARAYDRRIESRADLADAGELIKNTLASQPDGSVTLVQVGFSTNLVRLLDDKDAVALIAKKVKLLSVMGGAFTANAKPEYNIKIDIPSAKKLFSQWPTPIVASGFEIGEALLYPAASIERDYSWAPRHPIADAYRAYRKMPYDRPTWDLTSVLFAVRPEGGYFGVSKPGTITVLDDGMTRFTESATGKHRYLTLDPAAKQKILATMVGLASAR